MSCKEVGVAREKQNHMSLLPGKNKKKKQKNKQTSKQAAKQFAGIVRIHKQKKRISWEMDIASKTTLQEHSMQTATFMLLPSTLIM